MNPYAVIVDFGHMFHRCFAIASQAPPTVDITEATVYHFQGVLRTLRKSLTKLKITEYDLVFAEDRIPTRKLATHPGYRAGRVSRTGNKLLVKELLMEQGTGGHWCYSEGNEADDVIATLVRLAQQQRVFTVIVTADKDLWQLIGSTTAVFNPAKNALVTLDDVKNAFTWKEFAIVPSQVALVKALWGDAGDCVPNACPRTQKQILPILRQSPSGDLTEFKSLLDQHWDQLTPRCRQILTEGAAQVDQNWELVKLDDYCELQWH